MPAGAISDRLDRRRAMLGANFVRAALLAARVVAVILVMLIVLRRLTDDAIDAAERMIDPALLSSTLHRGLRRG